MLSANDLGKLEYGGPARPLVEAELRNTRHWEQVHIKIRQVQHAQVAVEDVRPLDVCIGAEWMQHLDVAQENLQKRCRYTWH